MLNLITIKLFEFVLHNSSNYSGIKFDSYLKSTNFIFCFDTNSAARRVAAGFDMDMSYTRVLHIKVAYRVLHK
jgi:hypothetical protein